MYVEVAWVVEKGKTVVLDTVVDAMEVIPVVAIKVGSVDSEVVIVGVLVLAKEEVVRTEIDEVVLAKVEMVVEIKEAIVVTVVKKVVVTSPLLSLLV